jgi:hypothetical protein
MACFHPAEERQRVFDGSPVARTDRLYCGLCGEILYLRPALPEERGDGFIDASGVSRWRLDERAPTMMM